VIKQRVLLISSNSSGRGGGERYLLFLAKGLKEDGVDVQVLLSDVEYMDVWALDFLQSDIIVHRAPLKGMGQRPLRFIGALLDWMQINMVANLCRRIAPDAILVNQQYDEDGLDYISGALSSGIKRVAGVIHMPMTATKDSRPFGRLRGRILHYWYRKHSYRIVFVSKGSREEFNDYYRLDQIQYVVNNSVPAAEPILERANSLFPVGSKVIGFIGQFVPQKNLGAVIDIWKAARKEGIDARLLLVGDGPEKNNVYKILIDHPPETWYITGWTREPEIFFREMDVFVLASHFEGLPLSLVEAALRGLVCVTAPFNGAIDVSKHAPWVRVAQDHSVLTMTHLLCETLKNLDDLKLSITPNHLKIFQNFFSLTRMVKEIKCVLQLK
jgi:glycosyltransferase involved in cell wall biosynthesis